MKEFLNKINLFNCKTLPRKIFTFYFIALLLGSSLLLLPISRVPNAEPLSFIDALFTASSSFSTTGLAIHNTGTYFSIFGQIVILALIQIGGLGLMTIKVLLFLFLGKKIGLKERISATNERGDGTIGGSVDLLKSALITVFSIELIAAILFIIRYYTSYFDTPYFDGNIFSVIYAGIYSSISSVNNAGIDIFGGSTSISMFANDYFIQALTIICFILGGLGFPFLCDIRNFFICKKNKVKFKLSYFSKFVLRVYFAIAFIAIAAIFAIELISGTLLYDSSIPLTQRISYVIFNTFSTRNTGYSTINLNEFTVGTRIILAILMWIGAAPASTGGGIRVTTFFICILALISYSKNKKEVSFLGRRIPENTVTKSLLVAFISQILVFTVTIILVTSSNEISFLEAFFESCSAFGTSGLSLGITSSLNTISKISIILLMFIGQIGVSSTILMWSNKKTYNSVQSLPEQDILIN